MTRATAARLAAALGGSAALWLAFPPHDVQVLAPVGVALLALATRGERVRRAALLGFLHGLLFFLLLVPWAGAVAGPAALVALCLLQAAFYAPLGAALALVARLPGWPLWSALLWVGEEALRSRLPFGGFPWGRLAFSQAGSWFAPLASVGGAPLVSAVVALVGGALAAVVVHRRRAAGWAVAGVAAVAAGPLLPAPPSAGGTVVAGVVQGGVPRLGLDFNAQRQAVLRNHVQATHRLAEEVRAGRLPAPELVVWPENASDIDPFRPDAESREAYRLIDGAVRDVGVPVLVGTLVDGPGDTEVRNTGVVWDPVTGPGDRYVKRHPVPFGEYIPYRSLVRRVTEKVDLVPRDFVKGDEVGVLQVGPVAVGDVICFEVAYDGVVRDAVDRGGRLLVVQTNNATFGRSGESPQQLAMGRLRAVEHDRAVLVAATSGISAVIAPDGSVVDRRGIFESGVLVREVAVRERLTLATRVGVWPEALLALAGAGALAAGVRRRAA